MKKIYSAIFSLALLSASGFMVSDIYAGEVTFKEARTEDEKKWKAYAKNEVNDYLTTSYHDVFEAFGLKMDDYNYFESAKSIEFLSEREQAKLSATVMFTLTDEKILKAGDTRLGYFFEPEKEDKVLVVFKSGNGDNHLCEFSKDTDTGIWKLVDYKKTKGKIIKKVKLKSLKEFKENTEK